MRQIRFIICGICGTYVGSELGIKDELGLEEGISKGIWDGTEDFDGFELGKSAYEG